MASSLPLRILGLDPGSRFTGYGCIDRQGPSSRLVAQGRICLPGSSPLPQRLGQLVRETQDLVQRWRPHVAVLEAPFHGVNARSLIVLAQARGALLACLALAGIPVEEVTPAQVKSSVTGSGRAGKEQVARMVRMLLDLGSAELSADASDALAVALCFSARYSLRRAAASTTQRK